MVFLAHDDARAAHRRTWVGFRVLDPPDEAARYSQLRPTHPFAFPDTSLELPTFLTPSYTQINVNMSLQPPSLAVRSKSASGGSTKAVILVNIPPNLPRTMHADDCRSVDHLAEPDSGLCLWNCPR